MRRYPENLVVLLTGILIALVGVIPIYSGGMFRNGAPTVIAVFSIGKGASRLRCRVSDVVLSVVALILVVLSKVVPAQIMSPVVFHVAALALLPIFLLTGLTLKAIVLDRRKRKIES